MTQYKSHRGRYFWGILFIAAGTLFLLDKMQVLNFGDVASKFWPLILILIGLSTLFGSRFRNFFAGSLILLLGVLFQLSTLGVLKEGVWHYTWPVVLILIGIWVLFKPSVRRGRYQTSTTVTNDRLDVSLIMTGIKQRVVSKAFTGGEVSTVMGSANLDLTECVIAGEKAVINISTVMGGVGLRIPKNWKLVVDASPIMGGVEDRTSQFPAEQAVATLEVKVSTVMGGVEIEN
jgi:predicted membrane protein